MLSRTRPAIRLSRIPVATSHARLGPRRAASKRPAAESAGAVAREAGADCWLCEPVTILKRAPWGAALEYSGAARRLVGGCDNRAGRSTKARGREHACLYRSASVSKLVNSA